MAVTPETLLWAEKYRPKTLDKLAMSEENRAFVANSLAEGTIPHLLLHGPPGVGKTTLAFIIRDTLDCETLVLNASKERGIDVIRDRISEFVRARYGARWNIPILDEADYLTPESQAALRNLMETYADRARFILTANYPNRITGAIRSRCTELQLAAMTLRDRTGVLLGVLAEEGIDADPTAALTYAERYKDLRQMLNTAQRAYVTHGELPPVTAVTSADGQVVLELALSGSWGKVREISKEPGTDHAELLRTMFWAVPDDHPNAAGLRVLLASAYDETPNVPDPVVHFLGTAAQIVAGV